MSRILVAGVVSLYAAVPVDGFPVEYASLRYPDWLHMGVGGVGAHVASILRTLGNDVDLCTVVGRDLPGTAIRQHLASVGLFGGGVRDIAESTTGAVLVAPDGRRTVFPHLGPARSATYPVDVFEERVADADLAVLTNIDFVRPLLSIAVRAGVPIAVDLHLASDVEGGRDAPWTHAADILFCSDERLPCPPTEWIRRLFLRNPRCSVVGVGCGGAGSMVGLRDGTLVSVSAVAPDGVRNTTGAGDSLFASFLHHWLRGEDAGDALSAASVYAGWKVGRRVPGDRHLTPAELAALRAAHPVERQRSRWIR